MYISIPICGYTDMQPIDSVTLENGNSMEDTRMFDSDFLFFRIFKYFHN